ncbi:MAG: LptF/LptG family permease [Rhizobiales bacterium]|nr:LptF/LptG family permease [Hyphomicrobiales bacterium]
MRIIALMISRMVLMRFVAILVGLTLFVLTLEVVAYSKDILALHESSALASAATYVLHRMPLTMATFLPMSLLMALLLTLTELSYRNELVAVWAAGISPARLVMMLAPLALLVGTLHFVLLDRAVPAAAPALRDWGIGDYGKERLKIGEKDPIWLRSGNDILRAASASRDSRKLEDVVIFKRDADGLLLEQIFAEHAERKGEVWDLTNATTYFRGNKPPEKSARMQYSGQMRPAAAGSRSGDPEEMTFSDLNYFIANDGFGIRPAYVYQTWRHKRLTPFLIAVVMVALCVPLAARFRRGGGLGILFALGVGLGFAFFVLDGISLSVGELGFVSPWLGAWMPVLVFAAIAAYLTLQTEQV